MPIPPKKLMAFAGQPGKGGGGAPPPFGKKAKGGNGGGGGGGPQPKKGLAALAHHDDEEDKHEGGEDDQHIVEEVVNELKQGHHDEQLEGLMHDYNPGDNPHWAEDHDVWERAKKAVDPEGKGAEYDEPWAVVAHVYKKLGGSIKEGGDEHHDGGHHDE